MCAETAIEWTATRLPDGTTLPGYTFNPWEGCQKVGPGCDNCYAEARNIRFTGGANWGPHAPRRRTSADNWLKPITWNKQAAKSGIRRNVFCASLADVMDNHTSILPEWRDDLAKLILDTPHLNWLFLTKRAGNAPAILRQMFPGGVPPNVWLGITVVNQTEADRDIPKLLATKAQFGITVAFLSMEPMLGPVDLESAWHGESALNGECWGDCGWCDDGHPPMHNCQKGRQSATQIEKGHDGIDWVIVGGESGPNARPMHPDWSRSLRDQCNAAGVAYFFKQWGEWGDMGSEIDVRRGDEMRLDMGVIRTGKARSGRLLDGREWNQMPGVM